VIIITRMRKSNTVTTTLPAVNNEDDIYGAVIVATVARVHPVHLMNVDSAPCGREPTGQINQLGM